MHRVFCSTGALIGRPNGRDYTLLAKCVKEIRCDGFEFMLYESWYDKVDTLRTFLKSLPVSFPTFHIEKQVGERISRNEPGDTEEALRLFGINCALAKDIGAKLLVLHLWNGIHSDKDIAHNIACYPLLKEIADQYGLVLTVENVVCNRADPLTHLKELARTYPDIRFTFDTKMAQFHRQLEALYLPENRFLLLHIAHIHANDYDGAYMDWSNLRVRHIGEGAVDFDRFFSFIIENGYTGDFTVECTAFDQTGAWHLDKLNRSIDKIRSYL